MTSQDPSTSNRSSNRFGDFVHISRDFERHILKSDDIEAQVDHLSSVLHTLRHKGDLKVLIVLPSCPALFVAMKAVSYSPFCAVIASETWNTDRFSWLMEHIEIDVLLSLDDKCTTLDVGSVAKTIPVHIIVDELGTVCASKHSERQSTDMQNRNPIQPLFSSHHACDYIAFTSGSSGLPAFVCVQTAGPQQSSYEIGVRVGISASDVLFQCSPVGFDALWFEYFLACIFGCGVLTVHSEVRMRMNLSTVMERERITVLGCTTSWIRRLQRLPSTIHSVLLGGESLPTSAELWHFCRSCENPVKFWNLYGVTERSVWSSAYCIGTFEGERERDSVSDTAEPSSEVFETDENSGETYTERKRRRDEGIDKCTRSGSQIGSFRWDRWQRIGSGLPGQKLLLLPLPSGTFPEIGERSFELDKSGGSESPEVGEIAIETASEHLYAVVRPSDAQCPQQSSVWRTGDVGLWDAQRESIVILGRLSHRVFKVGGLLVSLDFVEQRINAAFERSKVPGRCFVVRTEHSGSREMSEVSVPVALLAIDFKTVDVQSAVLHDHCTVNVDVSAANTSNRIEGPPSISTKCERAKSLDCPSGRIEGSTGDTTDCSGKTEDVVDRLSLLAQNAASASLLPHEQPVRWIVVDVEDVPFTSTGKVNYARIESQLAEHIDTVTDVSFWDTVWSFVPRRKCSSDIPASTDTTHVELPPSANDTSLFSSPEDHFTKGLQLWEIGGDSITALQIATALSFGQRRTRAEDSGDSGMRWELLTMLLSKPLGEVESYYSAFLGGGICKRPMRESLAILQNESGESEEDRRKRQKCVKNNQNDQGATPPSKCCCSSYQQMLEYVARFDADKCVDSCGLLLSHPNDDGFDIVYATYAGTLYRYHTSNHRMLWKRSLASPVVQDLISVNNIGVLAVTADGTVWMLAYDTGETVWSTRRFQYIRSAPVFARETCHILLSDYSGRFYMLCASTGAIVFEMSLPLTSMQSPAASSSANFGSSLTVFRLPQVSEGEANGAVTATAVCDTRGLCTVFIVHDCSAEPLTTFSPCQSFSSGNSESERCCFFAAPTVVGDVLLCACVRGHVTAHQMTLTTQSSHLSLRFLWAQSFQGAVCTPPVPCEDGRVVVATSDGCIRLLTLETGTIIWNRPLGSEIHAAPITLACHSTDGRLYLSLLVITRAGVARMLCSLCGTVVSTADVRKPIFATPAYDSREKMLLIGTRSDCAVLYRVVSAQ